MSIFEITVFAAAVVILARPIGVILGWTIMGAVDGVEAFIKYMETRETLDTEGTRCKCPSTCPRHPKEK